MPKFQMEDFIEDYPDQKNEDIQWEISERKEFFELESKRNLPNKKGRFFNHQELLLRYIRRYDRIFNIQATGTGKSGGIINIAEFSKKYDQNFKRVYIIEPGPSTVFAFKEQIKKLSDPEEYVNKRVIEALCGSVENAARIIKTNTNKMIGETYSVETYKQFASLQLSDEEIISTYSDCIFFLDEVHWFRNNIDGDEKLRERKIVYDYFWKIFHLAKRTKIIIATATPMINKTLDFVPLINLLLPMDQQLPDNVDENFYDQVTLHQLEPYFRGLITFIRFDNIYIDVINNGENIQGYKHEVEIPARKNFKDPLLPVIKKISENKIVKVNDPKYIKFPTRKETFKSFVNIVMLPMKEIQLKHYKEFSKKGNNDFFNRKKDQASIFVFPNGKIGREGEKDYIELDKRQNLVFKEFVNFRQGKNLLRMNGLKTYINSGDIEESLENLGVMSCKFKFFIEQELNASKNPRPGNSFCFIEFVNAGGSNLLGMLLRIFGFSEFKNSKGGFDLKTGKIVGLEKKKRFALLTSEKGDIQNVINIFNSADNMDGEYIQILIGSKTVRDGINLKNVIRGYIMTPGWHESGMYQAFSRFIRADSHIEKSKRDGEKVRVDIYRLAAVYPDEIKRISEKGISAASNDVKNYIRSEEKDIKIKRIFRFMKQCAFDAYLNYDRNVLPSDIDFSPSADYSEKYFKIWGSDFVPGNKERKGLAMNQGPGKKDLVYTTYNIFYSKEMIEKIKKEFQVLFLERDTITFEDFKLHLKSKKFDFNDFTFYSAIEEMILNEVRIPDKRNTLNLVLTVNGENLSLKKPSFYSLNRISNEKKIYFDFKYLDLESEEKSDVSIYEELEKNIDNFSKSMTLREKIYGYYIEKQNYNLFKNLLEDSIIRIRDGQADILNETILSMLNNYVIETKIPRNYIDETTKNLVRESNTGQGRTRGEKSVAGLKYVNLDKVDPGYVDIKVYVHFYKASEKTGYGITSILEGKEREIRVLDGEKFRDATLAENYVYNFLFNKKYDEIMKDFRKSKFYGTYISRGGENLKYLVDRQKNFFRIVDNENPRNKGLQCKNGTIEFLKEVLVFIDRKKQYQNLLKEKVNKSRMCDVLKRLFEENKLLFFSL